MQKMGSPACDYLLKPIDEEELNRTLKKICDALQTTAVHRAQMEKYEKNYEKNLITSCKENRSAI